MRIHVHKTNVGRKRLTVVPGWSAKQPPVQFVGGTIEAVVDAALPVITDLLNRKRARDGDLPF